MQRLFTMLVLTVTLSFAQSSTQATADRQLRYFRVLFHSIGDPDTPAQILGVHRSLIAQHCRLSATEVTALVVAAQQYQTQLATLRTSIANAKSKLPNGEMTEAARQSFASLGATFDNSLQNIGQQLLQQLSAKSAALLLRPVTKQLPLPASPTPR